MILLAAETGEPNDEKGNETGTENATSECFSGKHLI